MILNTEDSAMKRTGSEQQTSIKSSLTSRQMTADDRTGRYLIRAAFPEVNYGGSLHSRITTGHNCESSKKSD